MPTRTNEHVEGIHTWIRIHMGNLPVETKDTIKTLLDANGAPRYNQPKYLGDPPGLAEWYDYHPYPKAWIEDERADIATMFCVSQKVAFRVRKELRSTSGKDNFGRSQLEGRIHFFYDEDSQPKRWTG